MRRGIILCVLLTGMLSLWSAPALALDPALDMNQYAHTAWKIRDGFAKGRIASFAQTPDGYLWLGTESGLLRFDGIRNMPWQPPVGTSLPAGRVRTLLASRDGSLWIGTYGGLASWDGRTLRNVPQFDDGYVDTLLQDREGTVWVSGASSTTGKLCAIRNTGIECVGEDGRFGPYVTSVYEDRKGTLWLAAANGLWRWKPGPPQLYTPPAPILGGLQLVSETTTGALLVLTRSGLQQFVDGKFQPFPLPTTSLPINLFRDRDGAVWIGTLDGDLFHLHDGRLDGFGSSQGLSGAGATRIFEDREGNVWVATQEGVDRFRSLPAVTYAARQGLTGIAASVLADKDGSTWISTTAGLYRWRDGRFSAYRGRSVRASPKEPPTTGRAGALDEVVVPALPERAFPSLFRDRRGRIWYGGGLQSSGFGYMEQNRFVSVKGIASGYIDSIVEDREGNLWIAHRDMGLLRVSPDLSVQPVKLTVGTKTGDAWRLAADPVRVGLWIGLFSGGVVHFADGRIDASYSAANGLGKGIVNDIRITADGTVWAATDGGLSRIKAGRIATLTSKDGLPCDAVHGSIEDDEGSTWVYTACGLARIARADLDAWAAAVDQGKAPPSIPSFV